MADLIETTLTRLSLRTRVFHRGEHCGNWHLDLEESDLALFHFVCEGSCLVELLDQGIHLELAQGDLIFFPRPKKHMIRAVDQGFEQALFNNMPSKLVCAFVELDPNATSPLFNALPRYVFIKADTHSDNGWLKNLIELLFNEADNQTTASQTVIERLTDILFIHVIRTYLADHPENLGIIAALDDPSMRAVLELINLSPQKRWKIVDLAMAANLSRSAFIERFTRTLHMPPAAYLKRQRLEYAYRQLSEGGCKVLEVALDCGYENESSFCKAFKQAYGTSPGALKRRHEAR